MIVLNEFFEKTHSANGNKMFISLDILVLNKQTFEQMIAFIIYHAYKHKYVAYM